MKQKGLSDYQRAVRTILDSKAGFSEKCDSALSLMEVALDSLAELGLLTSLEAAIEGYTEEGKHIVQKYALVPSFSEDEEPVNRITKSRLEEDE